MYSYIIYSREKRNDKLNANMAFDASSGFPSSPQQIRDVLNAFLRHV